MNIIYLTPFIDKWEKLNKIFQFHLVLMPETSEIEKINFHFKRITDLKVLDDNSEDSASKELEIRVPKSYSDSEVFSLGSSGSLESFTCAGIKPLHSRKPRSFSENGESYVLELTDSSLGEIDSESEEKKVPCFRHDGLHSEEKNRSFCADVNSVNEHHDRHTSQNVEDLTQAPGESELFSEVKNPISKDLSDHIDDCNEPFLSRRNRNSQDSPQMQENDSTDCEFSQSEKFSENNHRDSLDSSENTEEDNKSYETPETLRRNPTNSKKFIRRILDENISEYLKKYYLFQEEHDYEKIFCICCSKLFPYIKSLNSSHSGDGKNRPLPSYLGNKKYKLHFYYKMSLDEQDKFDEKVLSSCKGKIILVDHLFLNKKNKSEAVHVVTIILDGKFYRHVGSKIEIDEESGKDLKKYFDKQIWEEVKNILDQLEKECSK